MEFIKIILISTQIAAALSKRHISSSDESIENLLYYKDCQKKPKPKVEPPEQMKLRVSEPAPPRQYGCPYPKMCCSLSCNNECGNSPSLFERQDIPPNQPPFPPRQPQLPVQPQINQKGRKKKKPPIPPIGGRREFGFTKERIKSLIAKDQDIRKILKDLVRVTMQKVDLVEMINSRRNAINEVVNENDKMSEISNSDDDYDLE